MNILTIKAFTGLGFLLVVLGLLIFLPTWSLNYWQGWVFLLVFSLSVCVITLYFLKKDPKLIESRVKAGPTAENTKIQKIIQALASLFFIGIFITASFDHRFVWSYIPTIFILLGNFLVFCGLFIVYLVFKVNTYTSAVIEIQKEQTVISTGPYSIVRHPMYSGAFVMLFGTSLALGSWFSLIFVVSLMIVIIFRLLNEETFLVNHLNGYREYLKTTRYRLIPFIW